MKNWNQRLIWSQTIKTTQNTDDCENYHQFYDLAFFDSDYDFEKSDD